VFANNDIVFHKFGWWDKMKAALDNGLDLVGIQEMTWYKFRFVEGSLFAARSETLEALQIKEGRLFDGRFKLSCEDVDLSERFLRSGLSIGQVHGLQPEYLVHIGHATINHKATQGDGLYDKMHESRRELCKKWGYPEKVED
jgi:GT2 family glycosyltransferase